MRLGDNWNITTAADHVLREVVVGMLRGFPQDPLGFLDQVLLLDGDDDTHDVALGLVALLVKCRWS